MQRDVDPPARSQQRREERPGPDLRDLHRQIPGGRRDRLVAGAVALRRSRLGALVRFGADERRRLGIDERLAASRRAAGASARRRRRFASSRSARAGQTDPGSSRESFSVGSLAGSHRASRDGPSTTVTDTNRSTIKGPNYTTPGDSARLKGNRARPSSPASLRCPTMVGQGTPAEGCLTRSPDRGVRCANDGRASNRPNCRTMHRPPHQRPVGPNRWVPA